MQHELFPGPEQLALPFPPHYAAHATCAGLLHVEGGEDVLLGNFYRYEYDMRIELPDGRSERFHYSGATSPRALDRTLVEILRDEHGPYLRSLRTDAPEWRTYHRFSTDRI